MAMRWFEFEHLHQRGEFLHPGYLAVDTQGVVAEVRAERPDTVHERVRGYALPGLPNLHGHAFQRAMAGRAERLAQAAGQDSFWTWRECMYDLALRITPEQLEAVAAQLYVEMLEAGMTSAAEFHYLHHAPDGSPYAHPSELSERTLQAADRAGLPLTMLPVFYAHAGVNTPLSPRQRRFGHRSVQAFAPLFEALSARVAGTPHRLGIAPHSLRAVAPRELTELLALSDGLAPGAPVHIHIAEQVAEVEEVRAALGAPPVTWLLDHAPVDARFCLVHATHASDEECARVAATRAVVGLCPHTEANLGDGIFPLPQFARRGGRFGVGTDSHVRVSAASELRLLEYPQRLVHRARNVLADAEQPGWSSTGRRLYESCVEGGAQALGQPVGMLEPGRRADVVVLDADHPNLVGHDAASVFDAYVFSAGDAAVRDVMVQGAWRVRDGRHLAREPIFEAFKAAMAALWSKT